MKVRPLQDRVLVKRVESETRSAGGIIIPDTAKEKPMSAKVIAIGTGKLNDDGSRAPFDVKVGDIVLTSKYGGTEIKFNDKEYKILSSSDILAIVG